MRGKGVWASRFTHTRVKIAALPNNNSPTRCTSHPVLRRAGNRRPPRRAVRDEPARQGTGSQVRGISRVRPGSAPVAGGGGAAIGAVHNICPGS